MAKKKSTAPARTSAATEVTRYIDPAVTAMLWARAAGRCQFNGCNKPLWKSEVTGEKVNVAQRAHIYSFSSGGPRGHEGIAKKDLNNFDNLMLVCHGCHQKIDKDKYGGRYSVKLLQDWKRIHEARVELVTGIDPSKKSHVILYGSNIGDQNVNLNFDDAASALFPKRYPATDHPIELALTGNVSRDDTDRFYTMEASNLIGSFNEKVRVLVFATGGSSTHLSLRWHHNRCSFCWGHSSTTSVARKCLNNTPKNVWKCSSVTESQNKHGSGRREAAS